MQKNECLNCGHRWTGEPYCEVCHKGADVKKKDEVEIAKGLEKTKDEESRLKLHAIMSIDTTLKIMTGVIFLGVIKLLFAKW